MASSQLASANPRIAPHLKPYQVPPSSYSEFFTDETYGKPHSRLVASAAVIHSSRVLLVQRAAHGFQPLLWELPGGRCESRDATVIASAVRELWEESGLVASRVLDMVTQYEWLDRDQPWKKITFLMMVEHQPQSTSSSLSPSTKANGNEIKPSGSRDEVFDAPRVHIDPNEQEDFLWATEKEVEANRCGDVSLDWTSEHQKQTVLRAFVLLRTRPHIWDSEPTG